MKTQPSLEDTLLGTLQLLEWRLHRLEYLLHTNDIADSASNGDEDDSDDSDDSEETVSNNFEAGQDAEIEDNDEDEASGPVDSVSPVIPRLRRLENSLRQLANKSKVVSDLLKLRMYKAHIRVSGPLD
jgi:hypothetical protein